MAEPRTYCGVVPGGRAREGQTSPEGTPPDDDARDGVDTTVLFATLDAIKQQPELARFQFRASNTWVGGVHYRSTIHGFYAACQEDTSRAKPSPVTPASRPCCWAPTRARIRPRPSSTRWPRA